MRLIYDHKVRAMLNEIGALAVAFDKIDANDLNRIVAINAACALGDAAFEMVDGAGADDHRVEIEFFLEFLLPLFAKIGWAKHAETLDFAAVQQFPRDEES